MEFFTTPTDRSSLSGARTEEGQVPSRAAGSASLSAQVVETNCAVVLLFGERAYKIKKPVNLGFLDFRSRPERARVCRREVELNRRLSPDVYLGVADVQDPAGEVCAHIVVMRRMPAELRLSTLVSEGAPVEDHLRALAHLIARVPLGCSDSAGDRG